MEQLIYYCKLVNRKFESSFERFTVVSDSCTGCIQTVKISYPQNIEGEECSKDEFTRVLQIPDILGGNGE